MFWLYDLYYSTRSTYVSSDSFILIWFLSYLANFYGDHFSWRPNFLETKFPGDQISWGPNFPGTKFPRDQISRDQISRRQNLLGTKKVWGPNFWGQNFWETKKVRGHNEFGDHFSYSRKLTWLTIFVSCFVTRERHLIKLNLIAKPGMDAFLNQDQGTLINWYLIRRMKFLGLKIVYGLV